MSSSRAVNPRTIDEKTANNIYRGLFPKLEALVALGNGDTYGETINSNPIVTHSRSRLAGEVVSYVRRTVADLKDDNVRVNTIPLLLGATANKFNEQRQIPALTPETAYSREAIREHVLRHVDNSQIGNMHCGLLEELGADFILVETTIHLSDKAGHVMKFRRVFDMTELMKLHEKAAPDGNNLGRFWTPYRVSA